MWWQWGRWGYELQLGLAGAEGQGRRARMDRLECRDLERDRKAPGPLQSGGKGVGDKMGKEGQAP